MQVYLGIDVGSSYVHAVVLDADRSLLHTVSPIKHFANPLGAVLEAWRDITGVFPESNIVSTAFTGSGARGFEAAMQGVTYVHDSVAIPAGIEVVHPDAEFVFHMGAKDAYYFNLAHVNGQLIIQDWQTGTKCGGGSGTLIEKQCRRLFDGQVPQASLTRIQAEDDPVRRECARVANRRKLQTRLETMYSRAQAEAALSDEPSEFLARCGVVVQSDLIHKQNEGAHRQDNLAGLFRTVARNYKIDVLGAQTFDPSDQASRALATGGVMASDLIVSHLEDMLGIRIDRPVQFQHMAAMGAAAKAIEQGNAFVFDQQQLEATAEQNRKNRLFAPPLADSLALVHEQDQPLDQPLEPGQKVVIGIDGGSTTTKGALVDLETGRLLDKLYVKTHGDPEASLKRVLKYLSRHRDTVEICGVGATGSARKLYEKILISQARSETLATDGKICVDRITDEITCHA
ncbi:MAG: CoA activase, partial [Planctomycetes bacterium]|nr:CoA activase [Planctomycetota bacterium]